MKKRTKSSLIGALVILCLGILLTSTSYIIALCTNVDIYDNQNHSFDYTSMQYTLEQLFENAGVDDSSNFAELSIELQNANLSIRKTDGETRFEFYNIDQNNLNFSYTAGTLHIDQPHPVNRFGFYIDHGSISFGGLRHIFNGSATHPTSEVIVHWNPADELTTARLNVTTGYITVSNLPINTSIFANSTFGNIEIFDCIATNSTLNAQTGFGNIVSRGNQFANASYITTAGNITLDATSGNTRVSTTLGNVEFFGLFEEETCRLQSNTTIGKVINPNGSSNGTQYNVSVKNEKANVQITTTLGDITLKNLSKN